VSNQDSLNAAVAVGDGLDLEGSVVRWMNPEEMLWLRSWMGYYPAKALPEKREKCFRARRRSTKYDANLLNDF
jgi:hypothetical protein